jgi:hypothetical protein
MTKGVVRLAAALGLLAVSATGAAADGFKSWTVCGGSTFSTCGSVRLNVVGNTVTLSVRNLSGMWGTNGGTVFTGIGLANVPPGTRAMVPDGGLVSGMSGPTRGGDAPNRWMLINPEKPIGDGIWLDMATATRGVGNGIASSCGNGSLPGGVDLYMTATCGRDGVTNASMNRGWVTISFDVNETWDPATSGTELMIKGRTADGAQTLCITGENCGAADVVPEPFTIALVGSGLAGIGLLRRRRKNGDAA